MLPRFWRAAMPDAAHYPGQPSRLDAWLRIEKDETIRVFTGKAEIGMGVETAFAKSLPKNWTSPRKRELRDGRHRHDADQGGVGGSTSIMQGAKPLRNAAATARICCCNSRRSAWACQPSSCR